MANDQEIDDILNSIEPKTTPPPAPKPKPVEAKIVHAPKDAKSANCDLQGVQQDFFLDTVKYYDELSDEIIGSWRDDRKEIQAIIDRFMGELSANAGDESVTGHPEAIVKALDVKTNSSANIVKLLESRTKLIQSSKNGIVINNANLNNNNDAGNQELQKILASSSKDDDSV